MTDRPDDPEISQSDLGDPNRGKLPPREMSGDAIGSGAGAGGGGGSEDFDGDPENGGGRVAIPVHDTPATGADAPKHGSR